MNTKASVHKVGEVSLFCFLFGSTSIKIIIHTYHIWEFLADQRHDERCLPHFGYQIRENYFATFFSISAYTLNTIHYSNSRHNMH